MALLEDDTVALYERAPCGYLSMAPNGTIVKVNETFLTWTGYQREDLVGRRTFAELLTGGGRIYHDTHIAPMLEMQGHVREIALDIVRADDQRLPILVNAVLESDASGAPLVIRTAVFDATERREYERELLRAKRRAEESDALSKLLIRTLQRSLIPPEVPQVPGLDVAAVYQPAREDVGGDFYDIFEVATGDWFIAVGDVCGKGVDAAIVAAVARHTIRAAAVRHSDLPQIFETLNEVLLRHETDRFCTVALVRLRQSHDTWTATVSLAGHPPPLLARGNTDSPSLGLLGPLLGLLPTPAFRTVDIALEHGDAIVIYTDGVTDARNGHAFFGDDRLRMALSGDRSTAASLTNRVSHQVLTFRSTESSDDIVIVTVRVP